MEKRKSVSISEVIELIENGKTRPEIREELGLTVPQMNKLFKHPKLKGRRAKKPIELDIIDDWSDVELTEEDNFTVGQQVPTEDAIASAELDMTFGE